VVLFGEILPLDALAEARRLCRCADVMLVVGTSGMVEPAACLPYAALAAGALVVEVNPVPTALTSYAHYSIQATATAALPALWERLEMRVRSS
jgi:NAD-dependent deacetylase